MLSHHAQKRSQQRGIPRTTIDLLLDFGVVEHRDHGLEVLYFDKDGKHAAMLYLKRNGLTQSSQYLNAYVLESSDGTVVTVGHRTKRINRI